MKNVIETLGIAIARAVMQAPQVYGSYDYSSYPGSEPPYVVKNHAERTETLRTTDAEAARLCYVKCCRDYVATAALRAIRDATYEMCVAGVNVESGLLPSQAHTVWEAMIDAASNAT